MQVSKSGNKATLDKCVFWITFVWTKVAAWHKPPTSKLQGTVIGFNEINLPPPLEKRWDDTPQWTLVFRPTVIAFQGIHDNSIKTEDAQYVPYIVIIHDDIIKWKHFPRYWSFVRGIHWSPVNYCHKGQWGGAVMFSPICPWTNGWANNQFEMSLHSLWCHCNAMVYSTLQQCTTFTHTHSCQMLVIITEDW